ncbi:hypothetical protein F5Y18DRAFT_432723 [Xylariaceae sp. FL1019]|nr:hypothetical protein F5Y18DRAFT_432723 [Xylariaceae sp. FL1019]
MPRAALRRPVPMVDEEARPAPTPPLILKADAPVNVGRSLTGPPPNQPTFLQPPPASPHGSSVSPTEDFIPILHQPVPRLGATPAKTPMLVIVPPPTPSDDGFTPVTPSATSPRLKAFRLARASHIPRDALGIATAGFKRKKSQRAIDEYDDSTPLSPHTPYTPKAKPARRTLFGLIEGWWDLGLLERGKSLRRK